MLTGLQILSLISHVVKYEVMKCFMQSLGMQGNNCSVYDTKLLVLQQGIRGITFLSLQSQFEKH